VVLGLSISCPSVAYTVSTGKADPTVDHQNAPVITVIIFEELPWEENLGRLHSPKKLHLASGVLHQFRDFIGYFSGTLAIDQNMNLNPRPTATGKSLGKILRYGTSLVKILGKSDGRSCGLYIPQHGGISLIAVE